MRSRLDTKETAGLFLHAHVHTRSRILTDPYKNEARRRAPLAQGLDLPPGFLVDLIGDGSAIDQVVGSHNALLS